MANNKYKQLLEQRDVILIYRNKFKNKILQKDKKIINNKNKFRYLQMENKAYCNNRKTSSIKLKKVNLGLKI